MSIVIGEGDASERVKFTVDADHDEQLTREDITASVHYVHLSLTPEQIERFASSPRTPI